MKLWNAIVNRFRTTTNEVAAKLTDPYADGKLAIEDTDKQIAAFVKQIATFTASNVEIKHDYEKKVDESKRYGNVAVRAVEAGNEDDAREAIEMELASKNAADGLNQEYKCNEKIIAQLRKQLSSNRKKVREAERKLEMLKARQTGVDLRKQMLNTNSTLVGQNNTLSNLEIFEDQVDNAENVVEALEDLVDDENASLIEKYDIKSTAIEEKLEKLKAAAAKKTTPKKK